MDEVTCNRCSRCCHYKHNGKLKKCKYLIMLGKNLSSCRIYNNRLGTLLDTNDDGTLIVCTERIKVKDKYEGCPYNEIKQENRTK